MRPPVPPARGPVGRVRVALASDAPLVVAGVDALLRASAPDVVLTQLQARSSWSELDVILYDPDSTAPPATAAPRGSTPRVAAYSFSTSASAVARARAQGAVAYLSKALDGAELATTLRLLVAGRLDRYVISPATKQTPVAPSPVQQHGLSAREIEVLRLIAQGKLNVDVAQELYLSINSVKTYIRSAYRKIGVTRRSQAVLWILRHDRDGGL